MISNPRHGSPPRLMAHQPTRCSTTQESSIRVHRPDPVSELLELDDVLESEPPAASTADVDDILQRRFELSGPVRAQSSERDANFRVDTSAGPYLLKITNAAEDP